jgi:hypothetical protein
MPPLAKTLVATLMFSLLGSIVARFWPGVLVTWVLLLVGSKLVAPSWGTVAQDGDVAFLSESSPSRRGEMLFEKAFPDQYSGTSIVLVMTRAAGQLLDQDEIFIERTLIPELKKIADRKPGLGSLITRMHTPAEGASGALLVSQDHQAALVVVDLSTVFLDPRAGCSSTKSKI